MSMLHAAVSCFVLQPGACITMGLHVRFEETAYREADFDAFVKHSADSVPVPEMPHAAGDVRQHHGRGGGP